MSAFYLNVFVCPIFWLLPFTGWYSQSIRGWNFACADLRLNNLALGEGQRRRGAMGTGNVSIRLVGHITYSHPLCVYECGYTSLNLNMYAEASQSEYPAAPLTAQRCPRQAPPHSNRRAFRLFIDCTLSLSHRRTAYCVRIPHTTPLGIVRILDLPFVRKERTPAVVHRILCK